MNDSQDSRRFTPAVFYSARKLRFDALFFLFFFHYESDRRRWETKLFHFLSGRRIRPS